ncbi:Laccase-16 [Arabidopsis thaliana]
MEIPRRFCICVLTFFVFVLLSPTTVHSIIRHYKFNVVMTNTTKLCSSKPIVTVNGQFPGPTIVAREGDTILIKVVNHVKYNVSIHWHGIRQLRTGWADGPAYITQCPIQPGQNYLHNFTLTGQRGTLWWHAHILWLRATVHGAIVILPKLGVPYPFPKPYKEKTIVLSEWWKSDVEELINEASRIGTAPSASDAHTINGHSGSISNCPSQSSYGLPVRAGKTYMLRIINAALNEELFFKIAGHVLTVVEVDAVYTKPYKTDTVFIAPGQTTNVLLTANANAGSNYMVAATTFTDAHIPYDNVTATATLHYIGHTSTVSTSKKTSLRSLNSLEYPARVPTTVEHSLFFTVGLGANPCQSCNNGVRLVAGINNVTFTMPKTALLQAHFFNISGVFTDDFPAKPSNPYDYTAPVKLGVNAATMKGTKLYRLPYNATVQIVLQNTAMILGLGNFNPEKDPKAFNLVDPVERNTVGVPAGGWTAIRFIADNPGVWFMHCHLELHTTWGLKMAFVVDNGHGPDQSLLPPPADLPKC